MENLKNKNISNWIKEIILKYCPIINDRTSIISNNNQTPELDINVSINGETTLITFLFGTYTCKSSVTEYVKVDRYLNESELTDIIDYIVKDHEVIEFIDITSENKLKLNFNVDWSKNNAVGISCGLIKLKINFNDNIEIRNKYISIIFKKYSDILDKTPKFKILKNDYSDNIKSFYINSMNKEQLLELLNHLDIHELRNLILEIDNDFFDKYLEIPESIEDKRLTKKKDC